MMLAPSKVPVTLKEITGNMMTLSYNVGLTAGSLIGKYGCEPTRSIRFHFAAYIFSS